MKNLSDLEKKIRNIKDHPIKGVNFKDITPVLLDKEMFAFAIHEMAKRVKKYKIDIIVGPEARGFIFGCPLAYELGLGFAPTRKHNKLPYQNITKNYGTEYSKTSLSIHVDAIKPGDRVLLVDDLLATGGTIKASADLVRELGGEIVGAIFLAEIKNLKGYKNLEGIPFESLITYK